VSQARVIKVDTKTRKVDLSQRSDEEREAEKVLAERGAGSVNTAGMTMLGAALARAGIKKNDFVDLSQASPVRRALLPLHRWHFSQDGLHNSLVRVYCDMVWPTRLR
jgi:hypothetical protein